MQKNNIQIKLEKDVNQPGIWQYEKYLAPVSLEYRVSLGEGNTKEDYFKPLKIYLKREDQNPTGSLKDRGMAFLVSWAWSQKNDKFVLSSSGNAAISAFSYCKKAGLKLKIFVSPHIQKGKLEILKNLGADVEIDNRPLTMSVRFSKENNCFNLRPSINKLGAEGYKTTVFEILQNQGKVSDIFIPVSSGVNLLGLYQGFELLGYLPRLHLCQSSKIHPLAEIYDKDFNSEEESLANALVAKNSPLKEPIIEAINKSKGTGWVIENKQISAIQELLVKEKIETSEEGALAIAAVKKAREKGWKMGKIIVLLTGKKY